MRAHLLGSWPLVAALSLAALGCGAGAGRVPPSFIGRSDAPAPTAAATQAQPEATPAEDAGPQPGLSLPSWARRRPTTPDSQEATDAQGAEPSEVEGEAMGDDLGETVEPEEAPSGEAAE